MRLIIWDYSCWHFLPDSYTYTGGVMWECRKYLDTALGAGDLRSAAVLSLALNHSRNRKLKHRVSSTINITGHLINMEPQAEFEFNGSKIQVCHEEGLVLISLGVSPLFLCCIFMCSLESLMFEWGGFTEHLESGLWFLMPCILVNWQSTAFSPPGTM